MKGIRRILLVAPIERSPSPPLSLPQHFYFPLHLPHLVIIPFFASSHSLRLSDTSKVVFTIISPDTTRYRDTKWQKKPNCLPTSFRARCCACQRLGALRPPPRLPRLIGSRSLEKVLTTSYHVNMTSRDQIFLLQTIKAMKEKIARDTIGTEPSWANPTRGGAQLR